MEVFKFETILYSICYGLRVLRKPRLHCYEQWVPSRLPGWGVGKGTREPRLNGIEALMLNVDISSCSSCLLSHPGSETCRHWSFKSRKGSSYEHDVSTPHEAVSTADNAASQHGPIMGDVRVISFMMSVMPKLCKMIETLQHTLGI